MWGDIWITFMTETSGSDELTVVYGKKCIVKYNTGDIIIMKI